MQRFESVTSVTNAALPSSPGLARLALAFFLRPEKTQRGILAETQLVRVVDQSYIIIYMVPSGEGQLLARAGMKRA